MSATQRTTADAVADRIDAILSAANEVAIAIEGDARERAARIVAQAERDAAGRVEEAQRLLSEAAALRARAAGGAKGQRAPGRSQSQRDL